MTIRAGAAVALLVGVLLMAAVACETKPPGPTPTEPAAGAVPTAGPTPAAGEEPKQPAMVEVPAPIDSVDINIAESFPPQYFVHVQSGLPNACHKFNKYGVSRAGDTISITVTNLKPDEPLMCAEVYQTVESNIALGSDFESGETYTVQVNDVTETFVAQ